MKGNLPRVRIPLPPPLVRFLEHRSNATRANQPGSFGFRRRSRPSRAELIARSPCRSAVPANGRSCDGDWCDGDSGWVASDDNESISLLPDSASMVSQDEQTGAEQPGVEAVAMMTLALDEARQATEHDDVPVGAIVVHRGVVIARRHNERELTGDPTAHAEVLVMRDAAAAVGSWRLDDCILYVTLEPCAMCAGAMVNARLPRVVFGTPDPKAGAVESHFGLLAGAPLNHAVEVVGGVLADDCGQILRDFFRARR